MISAEEQLNAYSRPSDLYKLIKVANEARQNRAEKTVNSAPMVAPASSLVTALNGYGDQLKVDKQQDLLDAQRVKNDQVLAANQNQLRSGLGSNILNGNTPITSGSNGHVSHSGEGINPLLSRIADPVLQKYGLHVSSGYRPNSKLKTSQHIHGNAYDIPWRTNDLQKRREIVKAFQSAGLKGFGVGNNVLHVDVGKPRHWTYDNKGKWISGMKDGYRDLF